MGNNQKHRPYEGAIKKLSRDKRKEMTQAEKNMWLGLRDKFREIKFRRQFPIENKYIVDFVCLEKRLIIEVDGGQHNENLKDVERTKFLETLGFTILRFWNNEVLVNLDTCLTVIFDELEKSKGIVMKGRPVSEFQKEVEIAKGKMAVNDNDK
jgi:very-short-patch-repair endonuclease